MLDLLKRSTALAGLVLIAASAAGQSVLIDFDTLSVGDVVTTQYPEATFSSELGFENVVRADIDLGTSLPNYICTQTTAGTLTCTNDTYVDFTAPVHNLSFWTSGDDIAGVAAQVDVYVNGVLAGTEDVVVDADTFVPDLVDLGAFSNVTRIEIHDIVDPAGLAWDDFLFDVGSGTPACAGDGSGTPCPCSNPGGSGEGCANGTGAGAILSGSGTASVTADTMSLTCNGVINDNGLFFQGNNTLGNGIVFGDGLRCCGGSVVRLQVVNPPGTTSPSTAQMTETATTNGPPGTIQAGDSKCYQYWYRDPNTSPCGAGFNLSNAVAFVWTP